MRFCKLHSLSDSVTTDSNRIISIESFHAFLFEARTKSALVTGLLLNKESLTPLLTRSVLG